MFYPEIAVATWGLRGSMQTLGRIVPVLGERPGVMTALSPGGVWGPCTSFLARVLQLGQQLGSLHCTVATVPGRHQPWPGHWTKYKFSRKEVRTCVYTADVTGALSQGRLPVQGLGRACRACTVSCPGDSRGSGVC